MSLPTGQISFSDLKVLGGGPSIRLGQYYPDGFGSGVSNIPSRGTEISIGVFRGKSYSPPYVTNGLLVFFDPGNTSSYPGTGRSLTSLVGSITASVNGAYGYSSGNGGFISLCNINTVDRLQNVSFLKLPTVSSFKTISVWYRIPSISAKPSYFIDAREGVAEGFILDNSVGAAWTNAVMRVNGGTDLSLDNGNVTSQVFATGSWRNIMLSSSNAMTDDVTLFSRYSSNEGLNVSFGVIMMYDRQITNAENLTNYNAFKSRYGL